MNPERNPAQPEQVAVERLEARRVAAARMEEAILHGHFDRVVAIEASAHLGPEYFSRPETLRRIEIGIRNAVFGNWEARAVFSDIVQLPIPDEFYQRPGVAEAALTIQMMALGDGMPDAIAVIRHVKMSADRREQLRPSAREGVTKILNGGDYGTFREYADEFDIPNETVSEHSVYLGYFALISLGRLDDAIAFAGHFPQAKGELLTGASLARAATKGIHKLLLSDDVPEADRLSQFAGIPREVLIDAIRPTIKMLIRQKKESVLAQMTERWEIPPTVLQEDGTDVVTEVIANETVAGVAAAWETVMKIREIADLAKDQLELAVIQGEIQRMLRGGFGYNALTYQNWAKRIRGIRALRTEYPIDSDFADRMERDVAFAFMKNLLTSRVPGCVADAMEEFPFLDKPAVRRAAIEAAKAALVMNSTWGSQAINAIQKSLQGIGARKLEYRDVAQEAKEHVFSDDNLMDPRAFTDLFDDPDGIRIPASDRARLLDEMREKVRTEMLFAEDGYSQMREELFELYGFEWETFPFKDIPLALLLEPDEDGLRERAESDPWAKSLAALAKLQARSANEDNDPWTKELFPLVERATRTEPLLDRESPKDGELLVEYVKAFGMLNLPNVSRVFFGLKRKKFALLADEDKRLLVELVGPKATRMESQDLINELRMLKLALQKDLLADVVPRRAGTTLGEEVFMTIRGSTQWEHGDRPSEIFKAWKETVERETAEIVRLEREAMEAVEADDDAAATRLYAVAREKRELIAVAPGYEETRFAVPRLYRGKDASDDTEIRAIVASEEVGAALSHYATAIGPFLCDEHDVLLSMQIRLDAKCRERHDGSDGIDPPDDIATRDLTANDDTAFVEYMEKIAMAADDGFLLALSATHLSILAPDQWFASVHRKDFANDVDAVRHRAEFMTQYLKEHYLNRNQDEGHTGHAPFSETLRLALERAWQAEGDAATNPILRANAAIDAHRARQMTVSKDTVDVALVPVQGPLRIYAGDIGDACYTKQHGALAGGEFPGLKAMVFVTNRGNSRERLNGSVLFVETRMAESNERVLVIRANNPRQNLVAQLDAATLVRHTVDAAIATARRRGIKHVGVVRDEAGGASSNREAVASYYKREYPHNMPAGLLDQPETNFNEYAVWDKNEFNPTVIVWTNEDTEAT